jgi:tRNA nucleotidyltransferase (CCA-adding enzyme)
MYTFTNTKNNFFVPLELHTILEALQENGVKPILVGGCVRDYFLNQPLKDYDIELYNLNDVEKIECILGQFGHVKLVGKSFGVFKVQTKNHEFDFALPRTEKKTGIGYVGFEVQSDASLDFQTASLRRDFTINSIGYDYFNRQFLDPNNGLRDLENKILRHIKENSFIEDPLRVYRAVQLCARFDLTLHPSTAILCSKMVETGMLEELSSHRIFEEFKKLLLKSPRPSVGFELLKNLGILKYFPQLQALIGCAQEYEYHPEGDVWIHTLMATDEMAKLKTSDEFKNLYLMLAIVCHDFGKPATTQVINGKITSYKHEHVGIEPTLKFLEFLTNDKKLIQNVLQLVENHLAPFQLYFHNSSSKAVKRLANKVNIEDLCLVCLADCKGRDIPDKTKCDKAIEWLLSTAKQLEVHNTALAPLVLGRDLLALGLTPSRAFKPMLEFAYELQLDDDTLTKDEIIQAIKKEFI